MFIYSVSGKYHRGIISGRERNLEKYDDDNFRELKRYCVAYSSEYPNLSMINIDKEYFKGDTEPKSLSGFEYAGTKRLTILKFKKVKDD